MINNNPHKNKTEITHFLKQNRINTNKYNTKNEPYYYAENFFPSDDEEY